MGPMSPKRSDGVLFEVYVAELANGKTGQYTRIFEATAKQDRWTPESVSLAQWAGKRVRLKFVADCGPHDNATTDHAHWGAVRIVAGKNSNKITKFKQYMTWVNSRSFQSTFYFQEVKSDRVDLSFQIEGPEAVTIESITAHASPDAGCRVFQHGLVLANPSHGSFTFDIARLSPGRKYRRLQGTRTQDPKANNGQEVGSTVTLGDREGLFLERIE